MTLFPPDAIPTFRHHAVSLFVFSAPPSGAEGTGEAEKFGRMLGEKYSIDAGVQTYKADCPPAVLTKFPLISSIKLLDYAADAMEQVLCGE